MVGGVTPNGITLLLSVVKLPYTGWHSNGVDRSPGVCSGWKNGTMDIFFLSSPLPLLSSSFSPPLLTLPLLSLLPPPSSSPPSSFLLPSLLSSSPPLLLPSSFLHKVTVEYIQDMCSRLFGESMQRPPDLQRPTTVSIVYCDIL